MASKRTLSDLRERRFSLLPPLCKEGNAGDACRTYLSRRKVWGAIKKKVSRENQELTAYSFRHRYPYYGHNRTRADGSYRAPKQIADAMGHKLDTHLLSYSRFQTKDLVSAYNETSLLVKETLWFIRKILQRLGLPRPNSKKSRQLLN